jgi:hypothetical protein
MKNTIAVVLSIILLMETTACHSYMDLTSLQEFEANKEKPNISVLQLQTDQFEMINFSEKYPGRLLKDEVRYRIINETSKSLVCISSDTLQIPLSDIKKMHIKKSIRVNHFFSLEALLLGLQV